MMWIARVIPRSRRAWAMLSVAVACAGTVAGATPAAAQVSIPNIMAPKQAAQRAVAKMNAQTAAEQNTDAGGPQQAAQPAQSGPTPHGATRPAPVPKPVAAAPQAAAAPKPTPATPAAASAPAHGGPVVSMTSKPAVPAKPGAAAPTAVAAAPKGAPTTPGKPGAPGAPGAKLASAPVPPVTPAAGDSNTTISVTQHGARSEVSLNREVFSYDPGARRDPFISLMRTGDLRPMLSDLRLVTVLYDATGRNSIAVMRDQSTKDQYRVRVGMTLGRMRVQQIQPKQVVFTIEEVGFSRQEALALGDSTKARTP